jgi:hypothetical protein
VLLIGRLFTEGGDLPWPSIFHLIVLEELGTATAGLGLSLLLSSFFSSQILMIVSKAPDHRQ